MTNPNKVLLSWPMMGKIALIIFPANPLTDTIYVQTFKNVVFSDDGTYDETVNPPVLRVSERDCASVCRVFRIDFGTCDVYTCEECGIVNPVFCGLCGPSQCTDEYSCAGAFAPGARRRRNNQHRQNRPKFTSTSS